MACAISLQVKAVYAQLHTIILAFKNHCSIKAKRMLSAKDVTIVYETMLSFPGMTDAIKISLQIPRKQALLLAKVIELGVAMRGNDPNGLLAVVDNETLNDLKAVSADLLKKAGLTEMNEKLNALQSK